MKKLNFTLIGLFAAITIQAQQFIPLRIDSIYSWAFAIGFEGDTNIYEWYSGYSYDAIDSLTQRREIDSRNNSLRFNYSYNQDTVYTISETKDATGNWNLFSRNVTSYFEGKITRKLTENYINSAWVNSSLHTYQFNAAGSETRYIIQFWKNGQWVDNYKRERLYDQNENVVEENEFYTDENDVFEFNRGNLYEYDLLNQKIQQINVNSSVNGPYYTSKANWFYGNDDLLDSYERCHYVYSTGVCENVIKTTYDHFGQDSIIENGYSWIDDQWRYYGKELTYKGQPIYSARPDSVIVQSFDAVTSTHFPVSRSYHHYEPIGNDQIYYKHEVYNWQGNDEWKLVRIVEEWYHLQSVVGVDETAGSGSKFLLFPNPSTPGQELNFLSPLQASSEFEVIVFDIKGQLISKVTLNNESTFQAPASSGIYTILIRNNDQLLGVVKQVVIDK